MLDELVEALLVGPGRDPAFNPEDRLSDPYDILQILPGIVSISTSQRFGREEIRLAHLSVKEYLISDGSDRYLTLGLQPSLRPSSSRTLA